MMYMIRKQLYLEEAQDRALKKRAKELGVSEAEVVRRALDDSLRGRRERHPRSERALEAFLARANEIAAAHRLPDEYHFDRDALYDEDERSRRWADER